MQATGSSSNVCRVTPNGCRPVRRASRYCPSSAISINRSNAAPEITFSPARFSCAARPSAMYWRFVSATSSCARTGDTISSAYGGTLPEEFPYYRLIHLELDRERNVAILPSGLTVPMRPFFGQLAVAPPKRFGRQNSKEPREFGGNIDCKELTGGSTIYLPVLNECGLFSTGDGHAAQGDGEVNGTAIKTSLTGTFEFHVRKDLGWKLPRAQTATHFITFGLDPDFDDAARQALHEMLDWIAALTGISRDEAYALSSFAVDLHVTQTVNNVKGVHAMLDRSILRLA